MSERFIDPELIRAIRETPETAVEKIDLVYVNDRELSILRKRKKNDFTYVLKGKPLTEKEQLNRIKSLVLPPAWENVRITHLPNGHLQATGQDAKHRKQYRYHPIWSKVRNQTKFYRMAIFGKQLPKMRKIADKHVGQKGWPQTKVLALIVLLMDETHIRIGNEQYAKRNQTYGLTTLRKKHVDVHEERVKFHFTGKRGKEHQVTLRNKKLIKLISRCEEIAGWELFKYFDENGEKQTIDSEMLNEYLKKISGFSFTAKDFRTWAASVVFFDTLMDFDATHAKQDLQKNILKAFDASAKALGNTRNVCRKYYVHPHIISSYEDGSIETFFKKVGNSNNEKYTTASEKTMLKLIQSYRPKLTITEKNK